MFIAHRPTTVLLCKAVLLAALLPSVAHAGDVNWSITVGSTGHRYAPPPVVYVQPPPVHVQPPPVYVAPHSFHHPRPVYVPPQAVYVQPGIVVHSATPRFGDGPPPHVHRGHRGGHHQQHHRHYPRR